MDKILTGIGILFLMIGVVMGIFSGFGLEHSNATPTALIPNFLIDALVAVAFIVIGVFMVILGIKKF